MSADPASLERLHDIVLPRAVFWWPPAPGWFALGALLGAVALLLAWRVGRRYRANAYRREALAALHTLGSAAEVCELLRRTALAIAPRHEIGTLGGEAWPGWLAARCPGGMPEPVRAALITAAYARDVAGCDPAALRSYAAHWIAAHVVPPAIPPGGG